MKRRVSDVERTFLVVDAWARQILQSLVDGCRIGNENGAVGLQRLVEDGGARCGGDLRGFRRAEGKDVEKALQRAGSARFADCFVGGQLGSECDVGGRERRFTQVEIVLADEGRAKMTIRLRVFFRWKWRKNLVRRSGEARARAAGGAEGVAESLQIVKDCCPRRSLSTRSVDTSEGGSCSLNAGC